jgi:hypothetical protein
MSNVENDAQLRIKLNHETSRMQWAELQRHFATGVVIRVSDDLDLVEVALRIARDDKAMVAAWLAANQVGKITDAQAADWFEANVGVWAVVVKPWILVQMDKPAQAAMH